MKHMNNHFGSGRTFGRAHCRAMPMNLQFFAEGGEGGAGGAGGSASVDAGAAGAAGPESTAAGGGGGAAAPQSFDDFLKDPKNQAEFDRRVAKALETGRAKMQADIEAKMQEARTEAEKVAKMNAGQKAQYEMGKRESELAAREAEVTRRELTAAAKEQLAEKGLPLSLSSILDYSSAEGCNASIEAVGKAFQEAVGNAVDSRLAGGKPPKKAPEGAGAALEQQVLKAMRGE